MFGHTIHDLHNRAFSLVGASGRWFGVRIDLLCLLFIGVVAIGSILLSHNAALAGLALVYVIKTTYISQVAVREFSKVESLMTSVERRVEAAKGRPKPKICTPEKHKLWSQCLSADHPLKEHDYCKGQVDIWSLNVEQSIVNELLQLHCRVKELEEENEKLRSKCLLLEDLNLDDKKFQFWTGFPNYGTFKALFDYLESVGALERLRHWRGCEMFSKNRAPVNKVTRTTKLTPEEDLFMVLVRLRVGLTVTDLALRFGISESSVSKIFTSWINLLYFHLKDLCEMPESETDGKARQFSKFPYLRVIINCTEIFTQKPSSLQANKEIYSNYKGHTTFKFLVGIDPHGAIVYVSQAWGGRTSDKHITVNSPGLTTKLNMGDELMADRGFAVHDLFVDMGVKETIPDFKGQGRSQLNKMEGKGSEKIAEARIHVERAIQRIKTFHILDNEVRLCMAHLAEQIFTVCSYLINFQSPILQQ
ncbi:hypothetical protein ACROYT_G005046 [Oculina patagonica]